MSYLPPIESDAVATQVETATAFVAGAGNTTNIIAVDGYKSVDFILETTTMASVTEIQVRFLGSHAASPGANDLFEVKTETEDAGTAGLYTTSTYIIKVPSLSASNNGQKIVFSVPVKGIRMAMTVIATVGAVANSSYQVWALRRA